MWNRTKSKTKRRPATVNQRPAKRAATEKLLPRIRLQAVPPARGCMMWTRRESKTKLWPATVSQNSTGREVINIAPTSVIFPTDASRHPWRPPASKARSPSRLKAFEKTSRLKPESDGFQISVSRRSDDNELRSETVSKQSIFDAPVPVHSLIGHLLTSGHPASNSATMLESLAAQSWFLHLVQNWGKVLNRCRGPLGLRGVSKDTATAPSLNTNLVLDAGTTLKG
jgi:hypothetical protein